MKFLQVFPAVLWMTATFALAEPSARLIVPRSTAWTGQRIPLFVELRAPGSFDGSASFDIPEIPKSVIIKIGNPVLSSESSDGGEVFVQRHEFALFSQSDGELAIPPITARFSHRLGYTGNTFDASLETPPTSLTLRRPPDTEGLGFLVTTKRLSISEEWKPEPGEAKAGAIFKRTIIQRAEGITGMAFKPAPKTAPGGVRVYPPRAEVLDKTDRGSLSGERHEAITYVFEKAGTFTLPEIQYVWWNPDTEELLSKTLPAATFQITAAAALPAVERRFHRPLWSILFAALIGTAIWKRDRLILLSRSLGKLLNPPERVAFRLLIAACRRNDAGAAYSAWNMWGRFSLQTGHSRELEQAYRSLMSQMLSKHPHAEWKGTTLADAVIRFRRSKPSQADVPRHNALPPLNPTP